MKANLVKSMTTIALSAALLSGGASVVSAATVDQSNTPAVQADTATDGASESNAETAGTADKNSEVSGNTQKDSQKVSAPKKIRIKKGRIKKVKSGVRVFKVYCKKRKHADGYQIRYSLSPNFKSAKIKTSDNKTIKVTGLSTYGVYFVQARAYRTDDSGPRVYGKWSKYRLAKYVKYRSAVSETKMESIISQTKSDKSKKAVLYALSKVGYPYSQARRSSGYAYDCSSLAYYSWKSANVQLTSGGCGTAASEAQAMSARGKRVSYSSLKPGSLIFYSSHHNGRYKNITHVAMYAGSGRLVEAANTRLGVIYRPVYSKGSIVMCANPVK